MTYHRTESGHIERLACGGHGRPFDHVTWGRRPATLVTDDGDGHYEAWAYTGRREHAAEKLAGFLLGDRADRVVTRYGSNLEVEDAPEGFWINAESGEPLSSDVHEQGEPNLKTFPQVIAW